MRMFPSTWSDGLLGRLGYKRRKNRTKARARRPRDLRIENLEPKQLLATLYWDPQHTGSTAPSGGTGTWSTSAANWWNASTKTDVVWSSNSDTAVFGGSSGTVTLGTSVGAGAINFTTGNYSITASTRYNYALSLSSANIDVGNGLSDSINCKLTGSMTMTDTGMLTLGGSVDNSGLGATVDAGTLLLAKSSTGSVHAIGGGGLTISGGTVQLGNNSGDQIYDWAPVTVSGGTLDMDGQSETVGSLTLSGGTLTNSASGSATISLNTSDTTTIAVTGSSSVSAASSLTLAEPLSGSSALANTGGTVNLTGQSSYTGSIAVNAGVLDFANGSLGSNSSITFGGGTLQWASGNTQDVSGNIGSIASGQNAILDTNGNNVTFASGLGGSGGGLTKVGSGTLTLSAADTFGGTTTVNAGTLDLKNQNALENSTFSSGGAGADV